MFISNIFLCKHYECDIVCCFIWHVFMCTTFIEIVMLHFWANMICVCCVTASLCIDVYVYFVNDCIFHTNIYCISIILNIFWCFSSELPSAIVWNTCIMCNIYIILIINFNMLFNFQCLFWKYDLHMSIHIYL